MTDYTDFLKQFESSVSRQSYIDAVETLHKLLSIFHELSHQDRLERDFFLRLSSACSQLFCDEQFILSENQYQILSAHHSALSMLFTLAGYQNTDHIFAQLANVEDIAHIVFPDRNCALKCLLIYNLNSEYDLDLLDFSREFPELVCPILIGLLASPSLVSKTAEDKFNDLLEQDWQHLSSYQPSLYNMVSLSKAWMHCSYAFSPEKHEIKKTLNQIISNWLIAENKQQSHDFNFQITESEKPLVLIPLEIMNTGHAMFRCFSRSLLELKDAFHTVALAPRHCLDTEGERLFSEVLYFSPLEAFKASVDFVKQLQALKPTMVYYPSLGMANYTLLLASQRLAKIQCFTLGHPATSHFRHIDYVLVQEQDLHDDKRELEKLFSETVIEMANETSSTLAPVENYKRVKQEGSLVNVAITSTFMKINFSFFDVCQEIQERSQKEICFYIFPGASGPSFEYLKLQFEMIFPNCKVFPHMSYDAYMQALAECHVRLGTFPFGGANSNMDCFSLGIPFVAMDGIEVHAHSDYGQLKQAGLEKLVADTRESYIDLALRLIEDETFRSSITEKMLSLKAHDFFNGKISQAQGLLKAMEYILENHESMEASEKRFFSCLDVEKG